MKKIKIYFAALIAAFAVTMGALPVAAEQNTANGFNMSEYYVETALENELGKEKYFKAYNAIKSGVENFESEIRLGTEADENEIWMIFNSYRSDHPEHFWLNPVTFSFGRYVYADGTCESFIALKYFFTKENLPAETEKINAAADERPCGVTEKVIFFAQGHCGAVVRTVIEPKALNRVDDRDSYVRLAARHSGVDSCKVDFYIFVLLIPRRLMTD